MELKCAYTLIVIFVFSKIAILTSLQVKWGNFQVLNKHPGVKKCAIAVLKKNDLVCGRVSKLTGLCEGLQYAQVVNQTIQSGYAYVKKVYVQENYQPPATLPVNSTNANLPSWYWWIPGVLSTGAKVEVTVLLVPGLLFYLVDSLEPLGKWTNDSETEFFNIPVADGMNGLQLAPSGSTLVLIEVSGGKQTNRTIFDLPKRIDVSAKHAKLRLSFEMLTKKLRVLVDGDEIMTYAPKYLDMITIRRMVIIKYSVGLTSTSVLRFEFTGA